MLLSAHFFSGIAEYAILNFAGLIPNNYIFLLLFVLCSIMPDFDMIFSPLHRNLFTHTPFFWGCFLVAIFVINQCWWILVFPIAIHIALDTIDYGVMLFYPITKKKYGLKLLGNHSVSPSKRQITFLKEYLTERKMLYAELIIMSAAILFMIKLYYFS